MLPSSVLESFEGVFLNAWIGHKSRIVSDGREFVWFEGDSELRGLKSPALLDLDGVELEHLLELGATADTPFCNRIVEVLRKSDADDGIFPVWDKIDIRALFDKVGNVQVEDFLHSLVSRHQDEIPYLETRGPTGGALVTSEGVERFKNIGKLEKRRTEFIASHGDAEPSQDDDISYWAWIAVSDAISAVFTALGR